jgi:hypothetical protein
MDAVNLKCEMSRSQSACSRVKRGSSWFPSLNLMSVSFSREMMWMSDAPLMKASFKTLSASCSIDFSMSEHHLFRYSIIFLYMFLLSFNKNESNVYKK